LQSVDKVVQHLATTGPTQADLQRVVTKMRSDLIDQMEAPIDRASLLAHAALFDGKPDRVNATPAELASVTPAQVKSFAQKYLVATNRTVIERDPVASQGGEAAKAPGGKQ
jgi:predicted Zn-dependent peptidase